MSWKKGRVTLDDGTSYPAEMLVNESGQIWNVRIHKDGQVIQEINAQGFAGKLNKSVEQVYPYTCQIEE